MTQCSITADGCLRSRKEQQGPGQPGGWPPRGSGGERADRLQHILLSEHVPFSVGSVEIEPAEPEVTGVDLFKQLLEEAEAARGKKREREDEDE